MPASSPKVAEWFYGGHQPRDVALAVALGILTGALTGGNASWAVVLLAAIALNVHTRLFLCAWPACAFVAWSASNVLETVGRFLLDGTALGRALGQPGDGLLIPLLGWNQYAVIGGIALGGIAAFIGGFISYRVTARLNRCWYVTPPRPPAGEAAEPAIAPRPVPPALACLWYGPSQRERTFRRQAAPRRLRRGGVPSTLAASLVLVASFWSLAGRQAKRELLQGLKDYNVGPVAAESTEISLWTGRFAIRGLHFAKAAAAANDELYVEAAHGTLSAGLLLRGYLDIDKLVLEGVRAEAARGTPRRQTADLAKPPGPSADAPQKNELVLNHHLRHWDLFCRQLGALEQMVAAISRLPNVEQSTEMAAQARCEPGIARPRVEIRQVRIVDLATGWNLGRKALLEIKNLSSRPTLASHPSELKFILPKYGAEIEIAFDASEAAKHKVRCSVCNLELPQIVNSPYVSRAVCFHAGRARLIGEGLCDLQGLKLRFAADVESLAADVSSHERLAGIEPDTWQAGLARLGGFHTQLTLAGCWSAPELTVDRRDLVETFRRQLQLAGATDLLTAVSEQLASREGRRDGPFVVQTSALDDQVTADPPGLCDFSDEALPQVEDEPIQEAIAVVERLPPLNEEEPEEVASAYPTTDLETTASTPAPEAVEAAPPPVRRPLPGPVNMAVGHDPSGAVLATGIGAGAATAASGQRENILSRWSRAWHERTSHPADAEANVDEPPLTPAGVEPSPPREPVSAAASEAWYNRRWR